MMKIFIDFDGTITRQDVGDAMFERFGGELSIKAVEEYREAKISAVECFRRESAACGIVNPADLHDFLERQEIDHSFIDFVAFCRRRAIDHYIVSDGMDYYIRFILNRHGLSDGPFFSNTLNLKQFDAGEGVRFEPAFPHTDEVCDRCASCKRNHMLTICDETDIIVYIGEGYSDRCPSRYSDVIFAKDELLSYCRQEDIPCFEYESFAEIQRRLETLLDHPDPRKKSVLRKRRQAELARRDVFIGG